MTYINRKQIVDIIPTVSVIILGNWQNGSKKMYPTIYCLLETYFRFKVISRLNVKRWEKIYYASSNQKRDRIAIPIWDKINNTKIVPRDKEGYFIMGREPIH